IPSGISGVPLTQQANSATTPSEQLRLNTATTPSAAGVCAGNPLGVIGGDQAGWPNGRRLEDDVTDVALRAVAGGYAFTPAFNVAPNNALGDGVNVIQAPCLPTFPYLPTPISGFNSPHSATGSLQPPTVPELGGALMMGSGLVGLGSYALLRYRA